MCTTTPLQAADDLPRLAPELSILPTAPTDTRSHVVLPMIQAERGSPFQLVVTKVWGITESPRP